MQYKYNMEGTCARQVTFEIDENNKILKTVFHGGCDGNAKGLAALAEGRTPEEVIPLLSGIKCGFKRTSCPDQFSKALQKAISK